MKTNYLCLYPEFFKKPAGAHFCLHACFLFLFLSHMQHAHSVFLPLFLAYGMHLQVLDGSSDVVFAGYLSRHSAKNSTDFKLIRSTNFTMHVSL